MPIAISRAARDQITLDDNKITDNRGLTRFVYQRNNQRSIADRFGLD